MGGSDRAVCLFTRWKNVSAVATGAGIWFYDAQTYREMALLTGHTEVVRTVAFFTRWKNARFWRTRCYRQIMET